MEASEDLRKSLRDGFTLNMQMSFSTSYRNGIFARHFVLPFYPFSKPRDISMP